MKTLLKGKVTNGNRLGHTLGFATANIILGEEQQVRSGVYAARVTIDDNRQFDAMVNIGRRPTVTDNGELRLEAHLLDFNEDIYDRTIEIELVARIRDERRFENIEALRRQLEQDRQNTIKILRKGIKNMFIDSTIPYKVADMSPFDAQTGPAIRYDRNIIAKQEALLSDPTMREIYSLMSRSIHEIHNPDKNQEP